MKSERDRIHEAIDYIDKRLSTIDVAPGTWGSPESLELQTLLLLELRTFLLRPEAHQKNPAEVRFAYFAFIRSRVSDSTAELLSAQLQGQGRGAELPKLLGEFRDLVKKKLKAEAPAKAKAVVKAVAEPDAKATAKPWMESAQRSSATLQQPPRMGEHRMVH